MAERKPIETIRIFTSETNIFKGVNVGLGLAVIIDPMPENEADIIKMGDDIRTAVMEFNRK